MNRNLLLVLAAAAACTSPPLPETTMAKPGQVKRFSGRVACPDHQAFSAWYKGDTASITDVPLADGSTLIPEFHDCQRLMEPNHEYGPLAAIWVPPRRVSTILTGLGPGVGRPVAVVHAWDGEYRPLGIRQGWNCLYLKAGGDSATMVPISAPSDCLGDVRASELAEGFDLLVTRTTFHGLGTDDYPNVGRWDQDEDPRAPFAYIGVKCDDGWCAIHNNRSPFRPSRRWSRPSSNAVLNRRVLEAKGWYDEQYLDVGTYPSKHPLPVFGTLVPDPDLDRLTVEDFKAQWRPAGIVTMSGPSPVYTTKLGLAVGSPPKNDAGHNLTRVSLCWEAASGTSCPGITVALRAKCHPIHSDPDGIWYARINAPVVGTAGQVATYKCVTRRSHSTLPYHIPGTARWSWRQDDATQWWRCDQGCCTVEP